MEKTMLDHVSIGVRDVAATGVIDGEGDLNEKTSGFQVKYRGMTEGEVTSD